MHPHSRRRFLKTAAAFAGAGFAPNLLLRGQDAGAKQLRIACVGVGGQGLSDLVQIAVGNQIVAMCDVDRRMAEMNRMTAQGEVPGAIARFPQAKFFSDYREMFAQMADQIDVVSVTTPDHMHFPIAMEAMRRGKHVYVQKPLSNNLWETRVMARYAEKKGVFSVMGNQGATYDGTRVLREWIEAGLIGEVREVHYWTNRPIWPQGKGLEFPAMPVPEQLNWDVWQGSCATERPYNEKIHPFAWRGFWDYGCGALGDIGCHSFNSAFWALDLKGDFVVEASKVSEFDDTLAPKRSTIVYQFPGKGGRAPVKVVWQDGVNDPNTDPEFLRPPGIPTDLQLNPEFGQVFVGSEGVIFCNDAYCRQSPVLYPEALREKARTVERKYDRVKGGPHQELCRAILGQGPKPVSNFIDHAGPLTEMVLAGNLAVRLGKRIDWEFDRMQARGLPEATPLLKRVYRKGWEPDLS